MALKQVKNKSDRTYNGIDATLRPGEIISLEEDRADYLLGTFSEMFEEAHEPKLLKGQTKEDHSKDQVVRLAANLQDLQVPPRPNIEEERFIEPLGKEGVGYRPMVNYEEANAVRNTKPESQIRTNGEDSVLDGTIGSTVRPNIEEERYIEPLNPEKYDGGGSDFPEREVATSTNNPSVTRAVPVQEAQADTQVEKDTERRDNASVEPALGNSQHPVEEDEKKVDNAEQPDTEGLTVIAEEEKEEKPKRNRK